MVTTAWRSSSATWKTTAPHGRSSKVVPRRTELDRTGPVSWPGGWSPSQQKRRKCELIPVSGTHEFDPIRAKTKGICMHLLNNGSQAAKVMVPSGCNRYSWVFLANTLVRKAIWRDIAFPGRHSHLWHPLTQYFNWLRGYPWIARRAFRTTILKYQYPVLSYHIEIPLALIP